jgi:ATP-binding cassette subfamily C protein CydD
MQVLKVAFLSAFMLELLSTISIATVAVSIGLRLLDTAIPFHAGYFILLLAPEFYAPLKNLGTQYHARMEAIGAAEQIRQFLSQEPLPRGARGDGAIELSGGPALQLSELRFTYPAADRPALDGVSLRVSAGSHVALVGPSGAGKSTLTAMIMGFLEPDHGSVSVEGTDLCTLDPEAWLRQVAWIPQHPHVFKGSIRDNIRLGMPGAEHARVEEAARSAHAHEFIAELADGYDTEVGERGHTLSGGQIQRLALARAFLQDAPLIVLDEPSAHLDLYSERVIGESLERLMRGKTCVSIAHRLSTVRRADRIVVLDGGRVVEEGDHEELLRRGGHYARVVQGGRSAGRAGSAAEQEGGR